jgi:hypothetical protein
MMDYGFLTKLAHLGSSGINWQPKAGQVDRRSRAVQQHYGAEPDH